MTRRRASRPAPGTDSRWGSSPATGEWNTAANWSPAEVPGDKATFGPSSQTAITFSASNAPTVARILFSLHAPSYAFTFADPAPTAPALTITGQGVSNNSGKVQTFIVASTAAAYENPQLKFANSASAGGSNVSYHVGPTTPKGAGGGVIGFYDTSTAGAAAFTVTTGAGTPPPKNSTVGGEVSFSDSSSAGTARFTVLGSTSTTDGDTFGNAVFHDTATAAHGEFTNAGGTVAGGDGGNTQFYNQATAAHGVFHNKGGTVGKANGGDSDFDGSANAGNGRFHNYAATASGGYGGVTSFNNNWPYVPTSEGASADRGFFYNYGATAGGQGGGHTFFGAKYGSPTAAEGTFVNYGSAVAGNSSTAGHTVFSITLPRPKGAYRPTAGSAVFWNLPGTAAGAPGGYTEFTVYGGPSRTRKVPTAGTATLVNLGATVPGADGGRTVFGGTATAAEARLVAFSGANGGSGGRIVFVDNSSGGTATIQLEGDGVLDLSDYQGARLTVGALELAGGQIAVKLDADTTCLEMDRHLAVEGRGATFNFTKGRNFDVDRRYTVLEAPNLSDFEAAQFSGNSLRGRRPIFEIDGNRLLVYYRR